MSYPSGVLVLSPATAYATKGNIQYPNTQAAATADETAAGSRIQDTYSTLGTVTVTSGSIVVES